MNDHRKLILAVEEASNPFEIKAIDGDSEVQVGYHAYLLVHTGMLESQYGDEGHSVRIRLDDTSATSERWTPATRGGENRK